MLKMQANPKIALQISKDRRRKWRGRKRREEERNRKKMFLEFSRPTACSIQTLRDALDTVYAASGLPGTGLWAHSSTGSQFRLA